MRVMRVMIHAYIDLAAKKSHYQPCAKVILFDDFFFSGGGLGTTE